MPKPVSDLPNPEVTSSPALEKRTRRVFSAEYKLKILAEADQLQGTSWFNGDDAVVLRKGEVVIDVIGQIGVDPGTEWGTGLTSTADNTLRRKVDICAGDPDGSDVFDPAIEWDGFATNTFDGLGAHTANCGGTMQGPKINEFSASTTGTDVEYVEVYGDADTDYSAYTILELEGDFYLSYRAPSNGPTSCFRHRLAPAQENGHPIRCCRRNGCD